LKYGNYQFTVRFHENGKAPELEYTSVIEEFRTHSMSNNSPFASPLRSLSTGGTFYLLSPGFVASPDYP
jgi:hypothetical protein